MKYKKIGNSNLEISSIILGTWVFGGDFWRGSKERDCVDAVLAAIDLGVNVIDTAPIYGYGLSEKIVGRAIKGKRDKVIIATKCGLIGKGADITHNLQPKSIRGEIEDSLKRLQVDCIDIYQLHWPDPNTPIEQTIDEMLRLKKEGKIKHIGVSNFKADLLREVNDIAGIVTLQNQYSMLERSIEGDILNLAANKGIGVITYGPLAGGILTGKYDSPPNLERADVRSFFYKYYSGEQFEKVKKLLNGLSEIGKPLNQVAINWVRQQKAVCAVIAGCRNAKQVKDNVEATSWDLTEKQLDDIKELLL